jgi:ribosomal-protein-serine acetyltransferase
MEHLYVDKDIYLEKIRISDAGIIFETIQHDRNYLRRWLPFVDQTRKKEDTSNYIVTMTSGPEREKNEVYVIRHCNEFAGLASYKDIDTINHKTEIGYWLAEKMQGKGIMTRTVRKMIDYGFRNLNFNRIQIKVAQGNYKSAAIPGRLGLLMEGIERDGEFHTDRYFDLEIFSILKKEWTESLTRS